MALGKSSIDHLSNSMTASKNNVKRFYNDLDAAIKELHSNENYNTFVANTDIGKTIEERLIRLISVGKSTGGDIEKLVNRTQAFLDEQRVLNSKLSASTSQSSSTQEVKYGGGYAGMGGINYAADPRFSVKPGIGGPGGE